MSDTYGHTQGRAKLMRGPKYTGWVGEGCWRQHGRAFLKRMQRRMWRRYLKVTMKAAVLDEEG